MNQEKETMSQDCDIDELIAEVSAVTKYREEKKLERELKSKAAKARLAGIHRTLNF
jgi:hypothetical protein